MRLRNIPMASSRAFRSNIVAATLTVISLFSPCNASANDYWDTLLQRGVQCSGLPKELILSVIWNESHGNPNAININGVGSYSPSTPEQALRYAYRINRANLDVGLMQVNWLSWGPKYRLTVADLLNPLTNVCVGSIILKNYIAEHKGTWRGVGRYNAVTYSKQEAYAIRIASTLQQIRKISAERKN